MSRYEFAYYPTPEGLPIQAWLRPTEWSEPTLYCWELYANRKVNPRLEEILGLSYSEGSEWLCVFMKDGEKFRYKLGHFDSGIAKIREGSQPLSGQIAIPVKDPFRTREILSLTPATPTQVIAEELEEVFTPLTSENMEEIASRYFHKGVRLNSSSKLSTIIRSGAPIFVSECRVKNASKKAA